jgi:signal transduction histidine kinase
VTETWVRDAVMRAARSGSAEGEHDGPGNETSFLYAERFTTPSGEVRVAVGVTEDVEFEDRYGAVITAVGLAGLLAVLVIAAGGWFLVKVSTAPIEASIDQMRRLAADAAHELRSPLTVLRARADVALQQPRDASTYVETLRGIESDASRLGRIVDDLFVVARADAGERRRAHDRIALDDIVADAARTANLIAAPKGVRLELTKYEEVWVDGDGDLLRQLVMILLDNAVKFTGQGGIVTVQVGLVGERPTIVVEDSGIGISREHLPHIFDRFFRADAARSRVTPGGGQVGAGLGLSIARWIADIHGGDVVAHSEPGQGTRMTVRFPVAASTTA